MTALVLAVVFVAGAVTGGWAVWHHTRTAYEQYRIQETDLFGLKDAAIRSIRPFPKGTP